MNNDRKRVYFLSALIFVFFVVLLFISFENKRIVVSICLLLFTVLCACLVKKRNILSINKKQVLLIMFVVSLLDITFLYLSGIYFGFYKSTYYLSFRSIFVIILPTIVSYFCIEYIRFVFLSQNVKFINISLLISCIVFDILIVSNVRIIDNFSALRELIGLVLLPAISFNLMYHYLSKKYGIYPNFIFRVIAFIYVYFIPYLPNVPDYILAFANVLLPLLIYVFIKSLYENKREFVTKRRKHLSYVCNVLLSVCLIGLIMLVSCEFRFGMIVVASESMTGSVNKGDIVIYEKYNNQVIVEGEIVVFERNNCMIVHRVVDIERNNNQNRYYTKGDANDALDSGYIVDNQIVGITSLKVPYIGYPSIWARTIFS